jgi:hypothetical protein
MAAAFPLLAAPAGAATPVRPSAAERAGILFVAGDASRLASPASGTRALVVEKVLQRMYALEPQLDPATAAAAAATMDTAAGAVPAADLVRMAPNERILAVLSALASSPATGVARQAIGAITADALEDSMKGLPSGRFIVSADSLNTLAVTTFKPSRVLTDTVDLAAVTPGFARARDRAWGEASDQRLDMTPAELLAANPALSGNPRIVAIAQQLADGTTVEALRAEADALLDGIDADGTAVMADVQAAIDETKTEEELAQAQLERERELYRKRTELEALAASVASADDGSSVTEEFSETADMITTLGTTGLEVLDVFGQFAAGEMGAGMLSGNLVMGVFTFTTFFTAGPSPEEVILQQIIALQKQIKEFQEVVERRFDQVDARLNDVLTEIGRLSGDLADLDRGVAAVARELAEQKLAIDRLQANLFALERDSEQRNITLRLNEAIGYRSRSADGLPMSQESFNEYESFFYTWATDSAFDLVALGPPLDGSRSYIDAVFSQLALFPVDTNVNHLRELPFRLGWRPALSPDRLPNPSFWAIAARAYSQLLLENPDRVLPVHRNRLREIEGQGRQLRTAIAAVATEDTAQRTRSKLFNELLDQYEGHAREVTTLIRAAEDHVLDKVVGYDGVGVQTPARPPRGPGGARLDPWPGSWGQARWVESDYAVVQPAVAEPCDPQSSAPDRPEDTSLPLPDDVTWSASGSAAIENPFEVAHRLGLGTLSVCWQAVPGETVASRSEYRPPGQSAVYVCMRWFTRYTLTLWWRFAPLVRDPVTGEMSEGKPQIVASTPQSYPAQDSVLVRQDNLGSTNAGCMLTGVPEPHGDFDWGLDGGLKNRWADHEFVLTYGASTPSFSYIPNPTLMDETTAVVGEKLTSITADVCHAVGLGTSNGGAGSLVAGPIRLATERLDGVRALFEGYAAFGLEGLIAGDDDLRSSLVGDWHLHDRSSLLDDYPTAADPDHECFPIEDGWTDFRRKRLEEVLTARTAPGDGTPTAKRSSALVASTLDRLTLTEPAIDARRSAAPTPRPGPGPQPQPGPDPAPGPIAPDGDDGADPVPAELDLSGARLNETAFRSRTGTKLRFRLSRAARVTATVTRSVPGRRSGNRCSRTAERGKRCTARVRVKVMRFEAEAGNTVVRFGRGLKPGRYAVTLAAEGKRVRLAFRVR